MKEEQKPKKLKISKILLILGIVIFIIGIVVIVSSANALAEAQDNWWNNHAEMPEAPVGIFLGIFIVFIGLVIAVIGARPYFTKLSMRISKETLDYAGEDISDVGVKAVEIAEPVIKKGAEVVTPVMGDVVSTIASEIKEAVNDNEPKKAEPASKSSSNVRYCSQCGQKMDKRHKYCSNCGSQLH